MSRKLMITLALALVLVLVVGIGVYAQGGPNSTPSQNGSAFGTGTQQTLRIQDPAQNLSGDCVNFVDENGDGICDNALLGGAGSQSSFGSQGFGTYYVDADGDGACDNFIDVDGDGIRDSVPQYGTGTQTGQAQQIRGRNR